MAQASRRARRGAAAERARSGRPSEVPDREPWLVPLLGGAFLVSGAAGLIHEVVWTRLLGHLFGVSSLAISTVLGAYMAGLALGSWWAGGRAEGWKDQRRVYAWLEVGIGLFALAVPGILALVEPLYGWVWRQQQLSFTFFSFLRLIVAGSILLVPTFLMGATLPALAEYLARREGRRLTPQWLYTLNLAGAVAGVALAGFVLMPSIGVWGTIVAGALLNLGVAGVVLALPPAPLPDRRPEPGAGDGAAEPEVAAERPSIRPALLAAAFASGLLSLATQVAWTRVLVLVVGSTTWAFSSVLLVYLICLGLGSALASRAADRMRLRAGTRGDAGELFRLATSRALCLAFALMAALTVVAVVVANRLPQLYYALYSITEMGEIGGMVRRGVLTAFAVLFPPILAAGTILPLALAAAAAPRERGTGAAVGRIYAVNTLGSIAGSVIGGFLLVPLAGSQTALLWLAAAAAAMSVLFLADARRPAWLTAAAAAGAAVVLAGLFLLPRWNQRILHGGVFEPGRYGAADLGRALSDAGESIVFHREGRSASVLVTDHSDGVRTMRIDARANASTHPGDMSTQTMLAAIPLLLAPRVDDVFVVGWGSGVTVGAALQFPIAHVTAVELEPAVVEASHLFAHVNHAPWADERLVLYEDDARHILQASDRVYDVIISEPPHPWVAGVANLFTQDFYRLAASRLAPDGVFTQWVQSYEMTFDTYRTLLATFTSVFPEAMVFYTPYTSDTVLVGSRAPLELRLDRLEERWANPSVRAALEGIGVKRPEHLLGAAALGPREVRAAAAGAALNTDDNMLVEFHAAKGSLGDHQVWSDIEQRSPGIEGILPASDAEAILGSTDRLRALMHGMRLSQRDPSRYDARLQAAAHGARAGGSGAPGATAGAGAAGASTGGTGEPPSPAAP